jgi:hypothetical protein
MFGVDLSYFKMIFDLNNCTLLEITTLISQSRLGNDVPLAMT